MEPSPDLRIVRYEAPLAGPDLVSFLWHKGSPWIEDIKARMEGKYAGNADRFYVGYDGQTIAAHAWYTVAAADRRLGLLGHVYTRPEYRRQGLAGRVMETAMADFAREGGRVMQLFTYNPLSVPLYERLGFEQVYQSRAAHAADWCMRHPAGSDALVAPWFAPGPCRLRDLAPADLPHYCLLYNVEYAMRLKDRAQEIGLGLEAEAAFLAALGRLQRGEGMCRALDNGQTIVAIGSLVRSGFPHQAHLALVDCYAHPRFASHAPALVQDLLDCRERLGVEIVYAMAVDEAKKRLFASLGFTRRANLEKHYRVEGQDFDCALFQAPAAG